MLKSNDKIVGIDPDVDKNGVAVYCKASKTIEVCSLGFFPLFDFMRLKSFKTVIIEAGHKVKVANFHKFGGRNLQKVGESIANKTGRNGERARMIAEMCEYLNLDKSEVLPLKKIWRGADGKITHDELTKLLKASGISFLRSGKIVKRTNQEERDATLIVLYRS